MKVTQDISRYTEAVNETARWLESVAEPHNGGLAWPAQPGVSDGYFASLGWGGVGPILFFADLYRTSADPRHLEIAEQGAVWLRSELKSEEPKAPGLFTGVAGFAVVFNELHRATSDDRYLSDIKATYDFLASRATTQEGLTNWAEITEILWGTAGIGCVLATIGRDVIGDEAMNLAVGAGDWLLSQALPGPVGIRWNIGEGPLRNMPAYREVYFPNFAHGSAGIAFFLAQLGAASGEQRFIDAALDSTSWILTTCRTDDGTCHAYHHEPTADEPPPQIGPARDADDSEPLYTLGWCHGPTGLAWLFRELHTVTGDSTGLI